MSVPLPRLNLGRRSLFLASSVLMGVAVPVVVYTCIAFLAQINFRIGAGTPWFVIPALAITWGTLVLADKAFRAGPPSSSASTFALLMICGAISICLGAIALAFMSAAIRAGQMTLTEGPGARLLNLAKALTILVAAGPIEEAAVRGLMQLRLQKVMHPLWAEVLADTVFVLGHLPRLAIPGEAPFLVLLAISNGRLAAVTQTTRYSALVHSLANLSIGLALLCLAP